MVVLALIPGPGTLVVASRAISGGFSHGAATACGIVCGDFIFVLLSIFGLATAAAAMGGLFIVVKYVGALYLIWLGIQILRSNKQGNDANVLEKVAYRPDFVSGLITTLGNPKAILFYLSFFPTFLDLTSITLLDTLTILLITTLSIGGVMMGYAYTASKAKRLFKGKRPAKALQITSGSVLIGSGALLAAKA